MLAALVLVGDVLTPLGYSAVAGYVIVVMLAIWMPWQRSPLVIAAVGTALTAIGYVVSRPPPSALPDSVPVVHRVVAVAVIWAAAALIYRYKSAVVRRAVAESSFRETFEQTAVGIAHVAADGGLIMVNRCFAETLAFASPEDMTGVALQSITHHDDLVQDLIGVRDLYAGDRHTYEAEKRLLSRNGAVVWVHQSVSLVRHFVTGEPNYLLLIIQNITDRKRAEEHLRKLQAAVEAANDGIVIATPSADPAAPRVEYVNPAYLQIFGVASGDVLGKGLSAIVAGPGTSLPLPAMTGGDVGARFDRTVTDASGRERMFEWQVTGIRDDRGRTIHWVAVIRDMTEKHAYERALEESEQRARKQLLELETLYQFAPIGLAMFSTDLRYTRVNDQLAEINGVPAADHIGKDVESVFPDLAAEQTRLLEQVLASGQRLINVEVYGERARQHAMQRVWREQLYPVLAPNGSVEGVGLVVEEITEQKNNERHLKLVMNELNHRVKNSLAVVLSIATQTLRTSRSLNEFEEAFIGRIRALAAAHTLLTAGNWRSARLGELIKEAARLFPGYDRSRVTIAGPDIALAPSATLALSMVFHELLANAMQHGALGRPTGTLDIVWSSEASSDSGEAGRQLVLRWRETGGQKLAVLSRRGFGFDIIEFTIAHEFGGHAELEYADGACWLLTIPWERVAIAAAGGTA